MQKFTNCSFNHVWLILEISDKSINIFFDNVTNKVDENIYSTGWGKNIIFNAFSAAL